LHAAQNQGFFDIPVDHLYAVNVFVDYFQKKKLKNLVIATPDVGGIKMARAYAKRFSAPLAVVDKRRISPEASEVMNILGEVKGKNVLVVDDLVATASSLVEAAVALKRAGALALYAAITHPVLSGPAISRIGKSPFTEVAVTDTIPVADHKRHSKIRVLSVAGVLGEAIRRIHCEESVSSLFD
ncbi:MAG: ribose-phosphate diphosphokinase, partial [Candidatus Omnitrophica bacterium]|nr:ribose-phosphate diphosphokinase [Candidatus Omnitrophota bacterium]